MMVRAKPKNATRGPSRSFQPNVRGQSDREIDAAKCQLNCHECSPNARRDQREHADYEKSSLVVDCGCGGGAGWRLGHGVLLGTN